VRSGDIVHYRVEKIRNRGRVWRYRGQASLYQLTPEGAVALAGIAGFTAACSEMVSVRSNLFPHFSQRY
jgi:hypothetical protein